MQPLYSGLCIVHHDPRPAAFRTQGRQSKCLTCSSFNKTCVAVYRLVANLGFVLTVSQSACACAPRQRTGLARCHPQSLDGCLAHQPACCQAPCWALWLAGSLLLLTAQVHRASVAVLGGPGTQAGWGRQGRSQTWQAISVVDAYGQLDLRGLPAFQGSCMLDCTG